MKGHLTASTCAAVHWYKSMCTVNC